MAVDRDQQQASQHGGRGQPEVGSGGVGRPLAVGVGIVVGARPGDRAGAVEPSSAHVPRISTPHVHVHVAELPELVALEEIRPTWAIENRTNPSSRR